MLSAARRDGHPQPRSAVTAVHNAPVSELSVVVQHWVCLVGFGVGEPVRLVETARIGVLAIDVDLDERTAPVAYQTLGRKLSTATPLAGSPISRTAGGHDLIVSTGRSGVHPDLPHVWIRSGSRWTADHPVTSNQQTRHGENRHDAGGDEERKRPAPADVAKTTEHHRPRRGETVADRLRHPGQ